MNISSLVVHVRREHVAQVQAELAAWPGVEVPAAAPDGRLVVTVEAADDSEAGATFDRIRTLAGVMSVSLVYHHFEPDGAAAGPDARSPDARMPLEEARHDC
jgi:nitrate reductase NapD